MMTVTLRFEIVSFFSSFFGETIDDILAGNDNTLLERELHAVSTSGPSIACIILCLKDSLFSGLGT